MEAPQKSKVVTSHLKLIQSPRLSVLKDWCIQILHGIKYLHEQSPPIIHRDIKSENIFINNHTNHVKIGDFGLATTHEQVHTKSLVGTAEFMAPQIFEGKYGPLVDIYSFGMTILQLATQQTPYSECSDYNQVFKFINDKQPPKSLSYVQNQQLAEFIKLCLSEERPSAQKLLQHPFLEIKEEDKFIICKSKASTIKVGSPSAKRETTLKVSGIREDQGLYIADCKSLNGKESFEFKVTITKEEGERKLNYLVKMLEHVSQNLRPYQTSQSFNRKGELFNRQAFLIAYESYMHKYLPNHDLLARQSLESQLLKELHEEQKKERGSQWHGFMNQVGDSILKSSPLKQMSQGSFKRQLGGVQQLQTDELGSTFERSNHSFKNNNSILSSKKPSVYNQIKALCGTPFPKKGASGHEIMLLQKAIKMVLPGQSVQISGKFNSLTAEMVKKALGEQEWEWQRVMGKLKVRKGKSSDSEMLELINNIS